MKQTNAKTTKRARRHDRIRAKVFGTAERPRFAVYRSNKNLYAQLIDDEKGVTLLAVDSRSVEGATPRERASAVGTAIAKKAVDTGMKTVVFDRGGFLYTGSIKALADSAREAGLKF